MAEAGLTHGGFYAHFASKDALAASASPGSVRPRRCQVADAGSRPPPTQAPPPGTPDR